MTMHDILDQLSSICGQPALAALELNDITFCGPYSAANAPKFSSAVSKLAPRLPSWTTTHTRIAT